MKVLVGDMQKFVAYIGLVVAVVIWSISFVSIDICLEYITASEVNVIRFAIASSILVVVFLLRGKKMKFRKKDLPKILLSGVFGTAAYYYFENISLDYISPAMVSIVTGAIPVMTLAIAMLVMGKRTKFRNIFFIMVSFSGIIVLTNPFSSVVSSNLSGIGLVLCANLSWVIYTLINEKLNQEYDKLNLLTIQMFFGTITFFIIYLVEIRLGKAVIVDISKIITNGPLVMHLLFLGALSSIVAYYLYNNALHIVGVTVSALFINIIPVATLLFSVVMKQETLSFNKVIGCVMVVSAVYFIEDIS